MVIALLQQSCGAEFYTNSMKKIPCATNDLFYLLKAYMRAGSQDSSSCSHRLDDPFRRAGPGETSSYYDRVRADGLPRVFLNKAEGKDILSQTSSYGR